MTAIAPYAKAAAAAAVGALTYLVPVMGDGITAAEWAGTALAALVASGVVYAVPNRPLPPSGKHAAE